MRAAEMRSAERIVHRYKLKESNDSVLNNARKSHCKLTRLNGRYLRNAIGRGNRKTALETTYDIHFLEIS